MELRWADGGSQYRCRPLDRPRTGPRALQESRETCPTAHHGPARHQEGGPSCWPAALNQQRLLYHVGRSGPQRRLTGRVRDVPIRERRCSTIPCCSTIKYVALFSAGVQARGIGVVARGQQEGTGKGFTAGTSPPRAGVKVSVVAIKPKAPLVFWSASGATRQHPLSTLETPSPPGPPEGQAPAPSAPTPGHANPALGAASRPL